MSVQLTFDDDILGGPLFVEGGEVGLLSNTHDMFFEVKVFGVEAEQAEPQLPHRLSVLSIQGPVTGLQVKTRTRVTHKNELHTY